MCSTRTAASRAAATCRWSISSRWSKRRSISERDFGHGGDLETSGLVEIIANLGGNDAERLHALILRHKSFTGSARAQQILDNWALWLPKFKKVMPVEYRRALAELEQEQARLQVAAE